jgi:tetratricopeptide (TPR) repeat protein
MKLFVTLLFVALTLTAAPARAQDAARLDADREKAYFLIQQNNFKEALPLLEKLHASLPADTKVLQNLALALVATAATNPDKETAVPAFKRARGLAEQAQKLGDNSELVQMLLSKIPADGTFGDTGRKLTPAEEALYAGEKAFNSGELDKAIAEYERAAKLEPKLYEAPLYIGDVYFKLGKIDQAGEAYARAIALNPDRDTAYRYWGNVLLQNDKLDEAREKLIEAVICEPYSRTTWQFLARWAQRKQIELSHPKIEIPASVKRKDEKTVNVTIGASATDEKDGSQIWTMYSLIRGHWIGGEPFKKAFPDEKEYRHSLREEVAAFGSAVESLQIALKEKRVKESALNPSVANLLKLHRAGLLEPFILFAKADQGIAQDYAAYRLANRAKLRQYLSEYVAPNK